MLHIIFGDCEESIYNTSVYFDNVYEQEWFSTNFAKTVLREVDKAELTEDGVIKSYCFGVIPPEKISGGSKTLLLMKNCKDEIFNASTCGDNCAKFILEIARKSDITINLRHAMDFGDVEFEAYIENSGVRVKNNQEYFRQAINYV